MILRKFFHLFLLTFGIVFNNLFGQNVEQVHMKNGSIIKGCIVEQIPGEYITLQAEEATVVVNSDSLQDKISEKIPLDSLPQKWKEWTKRNEEYIAVNGESLILTTLKFKNRTFNRVLLLEKGSLIKFLDVGRHRYTFAWGEMYRCVKNKRPDNLFSGIKDILVLDDGTEIPGQIIEQYPGQNLKILTDGGEILSFKFSQVKQIRAEKMSDRQNLWSQVQLLDKIQIKGEDLPLVGFISSRTLGKEISFEFENYKKRTIPLNQIVSYGKIPNENYVPVYDKILKEGEVLLNEKPACFVQLKSVDSYLLLTSAVSAQAIEGDTILVEANLEDVDNVITLVKAHIENVQIFKGRKKRVVSCPIITYQDLVQSPIGIDREVTPLGNIRVSFIVGEVGDYVLYIQGKEDYIVIHVIGKNG
ncbi:hypothetical protein EVD32_01575 [Bacteroidales bacterium SW299]|nr:hypothetical protein [Bacteroidales bacterium SW299]